MNIALRVSLLGNVLLASAVLWLVSQKRGEPTRPEPQGEAQGTASVREASAPPVQSIIENPPPASFHWSQLESSDYPTYLANLRSIGCPEQTIRDIITADLQSQVDAPAEKPRQKISGTNQSAVSSAAGSTRPPLEQQQAEILRTLLGPAPGEEMSSGPSAAQVLPVQQRVNRLRYNTASLPLVFQEVDPGKMPLTDAQNDAFNALRESFSTEIANANLDPRSPAYLHHWLSAQFISDCTMRGTFGRQFFLNYQLAALNKQANP